MMRGKIFFRNCAIILVHKIIRGRVPRMGTGSEETWRKRKPHGCFGESEGWYDYVTGRWKWSDGKIFRSGMLFWSGITVK